MKRKGKKYYRFSNIVVSQVIAYIATSTPQGLFFAVIAGVAFLI